MYKNTLFPISSFVSQIQFCNYDISCNSCNNDWKSIYQILKNIKYKKLQNGCNSCNVLNEL